MVKLTYKKIDSSVLERSIITERGMLGAWEAIEHVIDGELLMPALEEIISERFGGIHLTLTITEKSKAVKNHDCCLGV